MLTAAPTIKTVSFADFYAAIPLPPGVTDPLNAEQQQAVRHSFSTPLWVIAGPGTGKTYTLVWLVLKRMLVDGVPPHRIMLTTFTRKAATELRTRLIQARQDLVRAGLTVAEELDLSQLLLGTLHELCSDLLQRHRHPDTLRVRVLGDDLSQQFFVRRTRNPLMDCDDLAFWDKFRMLKEPKLYAPNRAKRAEYACKLFNRMTENSVDVPLMRASGDPIFEKLADAYDEYRDMLYRGNRTDQAHLQRHFLNFLKSPAGAAWVEDGLTVVVDEYQDTNPIQEEIYFTLVGGRGDLTVVGDDDQSLYRFRGATVESLTNFDDACLHYLKRKPLPLYLMENRRSHPDIVKWVNEFIGGPGGMSSHPEMLDPHVRVRAPGKPPLVAKSSLGGSYPAVAAIAEANNPGAAAKVAGLVADIWNSGLLEDPSQIALLTFIARESTHAIGAYTDALRAAGLNVYNPRSRQAHIDERLLALVGAFSMLLDPTFRLTDLPKLPSGVPKYLECARKAFQVLIDSGSYPDLEDYIVKSIDAIEKSFYDPVDPHSQFLRRTGRKRGQHATFAHLLYKLLSHEPFASDLTKADGGDRIKALNLIMAEYESLYSDGQIKLEPDPSGRTRVANRTLYDFYSVLIEGIHDGLNDPEDEDISVQPGAVNVMTIHQAKGLEFEVVIVLRPDKQPFVSDTYELEDQFDAFTSRPTKPARRRTQDERAAEDTIRLFFVAYSRAKRLLVTAGQLNPKVAPDWDRVMGATYGSGRITRKADLRTLGVHLL